MPLGHGSIVAAGSNDGVCIWLHGDYDLSARERRHCENAERPKAKAVQAVQAVRRIVKPGVGVRESKHALLEAASRRSLAVRGVAPTLLPPGQCANADAPQSRYSTHFRTAGRCGCTTTRCKSYNTNPPAGRDCHGPDAAPPRTQPSPAVVHFRGNNRPGRRLRNRYIPPQTHRRLALWIKATALHVTECSH